MANIIKTLRKSNYDYINSFRKLQLGQIWLKQPWENVDLKYEHYSHLFKVENPLQEFSNDLGDIFANVSNDFKFNIAISFLKPVLDFIKLDNLDFLLMVDKGNTMSFTFSEVRDRYYEEGKIEEFLQNTDFNHSNSNALKSLKKDQLLFIGGLIEAKEIKISMNGKIKSSFNFPEIKGADIKIDTQTDTELKISINAEDYFPFGVKVYRIIWDENFEKLRIVSDNRNFF